MSMIPRLTTKRLLERLAARENVGRERAISDLGAGLPQAGVTELAELLEVELGIPAGLLRADDRIDALLAPFAIGNPLTWLWAEGALEDGISEISYRLKQRGGLRDRAPTTVRELFEAWCGMPAA